MSLAESLAPLGPPQAVGIGQINERARLVLGDCLDHVTGLASLPDQSVDHVITDPPYDSHVDANSMRGTGHRRGTFKAASKKALGFAPITVGRMDAMADQLARVATRWVLVFCAVEQVSDWRGALVGSGLEYVRCGAWLKDNATPQFTGDRPAAGFEALVIAHRPGRKRWNGGGKLGVWRTSTAYREGDVVEHPTQKPLALMRALVEDFTDANDLILDPFAGSGTTGVAALTLGRRFIGWEMDPKHHATAARRIGETREQPSLLGPRGPKAKQQGLGL